MKILGIDFETQGKDPKVDLPTEVGCVMVEFAPDCPHEGRAYKRNDPYNQLIKSKNQTKQSAEVIEVTGITDEMIEKDGMEEVLIATEVWNLVNEADYVLAHNANFDRQVFLAMCARHSLEVPATPWVCTYTEVEYPAKYRCKKLSHLAYDHGIIVDPDTLHRAADDVNLMLMLVTTKYDILDIIEYASSPWVFLRAVVPSPWTDGKEGTNWAKSQGYGWEGAPGTDTPKFPKLWVKRVKAKNLEREMSDKPYQIVNLTELEKAHASN